MPFEEVTIGSARLIRGDCRDVLSKLPTESVHCCVTSPPYFGLRDYKVAGQIGLEPTPAEYVARMVEIMREVRRVLRPDGTLWLNIGDSYANNWNGSGGGLSASTLGSNDGKPGRGIKQWDASARGYKRVPPGIKAKDLIGIPWMLAFALRDDGWYLRRDIIWHKPNPMPESVTDRPTSAHEYLFLLTKSARYYYDNEAIKEPATNGERFHGAYDKRPGAVRERNGRLDLVNTTSTRNKRSVWTIATAPFKGAHFATFPPALVEPCILAGTSERGVCSKCGAPWERVTRRKTLRQLADEQGTWSERPGAAQYGAEAMTSQRRDRTSGLSASKGGPRAPEVELMGWRPICKCKAQTPIPATTLDPFGGAATTALVSERLGRRSVSIELSAAYHNIACERITKAQIIQKAA